MPDFYWVVLGALLTAYYIFALTIVLVGPVEDFS